MPIRGLTRADTGFRSILTRRQTRTATRPFTRLDFRMTKRIRMTRPIRFTTVTTRIDFVSRP